ncbi:MAG: type II toxin-antitoxin system HigB family toxin [Anaerolineaceae bacterium]|nr:type II toxin-antitoxin system HigB family toxin [Anaerolineaceae bacterium]
MRIISRRILRDFWENHPDAANPLQTWVHDVEQADWNSPADIKSVYPTARFASNNRVLFNLKGNHYRLVVVVIYKYCLVYIRFVWTLEQVDQMDETAL